MMENSAWKEVALGNLINYKKGYAFKSKEYTNIGTTVVRVSDTTDNSVNLANCVKIPEYIANQKLEYVLQENDIIINSVGSWPDNPNSVVGKVVKFPSYNEVALLNQNAIRLRSESEKAYQQYIYYKLKSEDFFLYLVSNAQGSGNQASITLNDVFKYSFELPPLPEQKAIASVLSSLDDKIDLLHQQNQTLEALAETLFRQWFIEEAKEDWEEGNISDLVDFNPKRVLAKNTVAPFLEMANLSTITYSPLYWYNRAFTSGTKFQNGDTLLARITPCLENGKTAYVDFLEDNQIAWGSTEYIVMRSRRDIHPFFTYVLAKSQEFRDFAQACMSGSSGRQRVDVKNLMSFEFKIPEKSTITKWNKFAKSTVKKTKNNNDQIMTLTSLRDVLLPKLTSGEVRVEM